MSSKGIQLGGSQQLQHIVCNRSTQSNVCSLEKGLGQCFTSHLCTTQVAAWSRAQWDSRVPSLSTNVDGSSAHSSMAPFESIGLCIMQFGTLVQDLMARPEIVQFACRAAPPLMTDTDSYGAAAMVLMWKCSLAGVPSRHCNCLQPITNTAIWPQWHGYAPL